MTMAAPVLTPAEQKKGLSGKKNKKRVVKNVLGLPSNFKVSSPLVEAKEAEKLNEILYRLLPSARLPISQNVKFKKPKIQKEPIVEEVCVEEHAKNKRSQLSLGVNEVNKSIKREVISAMLLASDIQPKFFVQHLNLLCTQKNIPFLYLPHLREITKNSLGFTCIALGFKKNFSDFSEAVNEIKSIAKTLNNCSKDENQENLREIMEPDEMTDSEDSRTSEIINDATFTYLYRTSTKLRVFIPEIQKSGLLPQKSELDFISVSEGNDSKIETKVNFEFRKKSLKKKKTKKTLKDLSFETDEEEDLESSEKKRKISWEIDKSGTKKKFKYQPVQLLKIPSNPGRIGKLK